MVPENKIKKTSEEIKSSILMSLKDGPKSVTEISESINSNWITVEEYLKKLKEDGEVIEIVSSPKMKVYRRTDDLAFYGIPFSKKIRNDTFDLLCLIAKMWKKQNNGISPSRTILQKVAVEFIEQSPEITNIPVLKFHYGQTLALRYEEKLINECDELKLTSEQEKKLFKLIEEYKNWSSGKAQSEQYKKQGMEFYRTKEDLLSTFSKNKPEEIIKKILELSVFYPSELEETYNLFDKFEYCAINVLNIEKKEREDYVKKIKEIFPLIWDIITTSYFFYEAKDFIEENKKELFNYLRLNTINSKLSNVIPLIEDLKSEIDTIPQKEISTKSSEKSKDLLNKLLNGL